MGALRRELSITLRDTPSYRTRVSLEKEAATHPGGVGADTPPTKPLTPQSGVRGCREECTSKRGRWPGEGDTGVAGEGGDCSDEQGGVDRRVGDDGTMRANRMGWRADSANRARSLHEVT